MTTEPNTIPRQVPSAHGSLRTLLSILFRRKKLMLTVFASILILAVIFCLVVPPTFEASSVIIVEREVEPEKSMLFGLNFWKHYDNYDWLKSEIEIIKSFKVAARIAEEFGWQESGTQSAAGLPGDAGLSLRKKIDKFQKELRVNNPDDSNIIGLSYRGKDPQEIAAIVNRVVQSYTDYRSEIYKESQTYKFFEQQLHLSSMKLKELEKNLTRYKVKEKIISPDRQGELLLNKLAEYQNRLTDIHTSRIAKEARLQVITTQVSGGSSTNIPSTEVSDGPSREKHIAKLKDTLLEKEIARESMLQRFDPTYRKVVNLENEIKTLKDKVRNEINQILEQEQTAIQALMAQEKALTRSMRSIEEEITRFAEKENDFEQLNRGITDNRQIYSMLLKQREEARISLAKLQSGVKIRVVNPAVAPVEAVFPKKGLFLFSAFVLGLFLALALALLRDYFDHSIHSVQDAAAATGLPVLGAVSDHQHLKQA